MNYYIADTHFYHKNILQYENRPFNTVEEMNKHIIKCWNTKINNKDTVYILGDFAFAKTEKIEELLEQLNGNKILIKGNHDIFLRNKKFNQKLFIKIVDYLEIKDGQYDLVLSHYPFAIWNKKHYGAIHLYGHVHSASKEESSPIFPVLNSLENAYNVGVDIIGYSPLSLKEILEKT